MAIEINAQPFNRKSPEFYEDCLVTDPQVESYLCWAKGTIAVKRTRGTWPIPTRKIGRSVRNRVGDVLDYFVPLKQTA